MSKINKINTYWHYNLANHTNVLIYDIAKKSEKV